MVSPDRLVIEYFLPRDIGGPVKWPDGVYGESWVPTEEDGNVHRDTYTILKKRLERFSSKDQQQGWFLAINDGNDSWMILPSERGYLVGKVETQESKNGKVHMPSAIDVTMWWRLLPGRVQVINEASMAVALEQVAQLDKRLRGISDKSWLGHAGPTEMG